VKAIVTGGAGFIGSHLVDLLLQKNMNVVVLDNFSTGRETNLSHVRDKIKLIETDISELGSWTQEFKDSQFVFHIAALADIVPSIQNPDGYYKSNVTGTFNVLQASRLGKINKFVYAASSSCYGIPDNYPTSEIADIRPQYPYALTKRMGEELVLHWGQVYKLPVLSTRFFNVYGPRSRTSGTYGAVFGVFLAQKLANQAFTVVGDGNQTRDFTYVSDVAEALYSVSQSDKSLEIYNVGSGATISVNRIVELLKGDKTYIPKRPGEPDCTFADISKIKKEIGWSPKVSIEEGILKLIENIDYWKEAPVWTPDKIKEATSDWFKFLGNES
jgi:UDP-glucose 4-epimerase